MREKILLIWIVIKNVKMNIIGMDEKSFKEYVDKLGLDYNSVKNKGVLVNNYSYINAEGVRMENGIYNYKRMRQSKVLIMVVHSKLMFQKLQM